ncbi:MAG TPA: MOSC N-terminal beta barrel domain-containing protein, partial [Thermomicrobiales bacterium]|nr:MOSC N-terminal beta barrel domain-containing protein [Thermomicrobiales bacterium]
DGVVGSVVSLWRYPVKSMLGEELSASLVGARGLLGDRAFALVDGADGKVATAKNPRKWPRLFDCRARFRDEPRGDAPLPPVRITLPDGSDVGSDAPDRDDALSRALGRAVTLAAADRDIAPPATSTPRKGTVKAEAYSPDIDGLDRRDVVEDFSLAEGLFFDSAVIHLLTTAALDRLRELYPAGRFEIRRFRPNLVIDPAGSEPGFVEEAWIGKTIAIGDSVLLRVVKPCARCVMTTLPQSDLPRDLGILRAAVQHNAANVGVYAAVERGGAIRRGDLVRFGL